MDLGLESNQYQKIGNFVVGIFIFTLGGMLAEICILELMTYITWYLNPPENKRRHKKANRS
jgi:hypothetical protein